MTYQNACETALPVHTPLACWDFFHREVKAWERHGKPRMRWKVPGMRAAGTVPTVCESGTQQCCPPAHGQAGLAELAEAPEHSFSWALDIRL